MLRGRGGDGKSTTANSMAGREFLSESRSTVGVGMLDVELRQTDLQAAEFRPACCIQYAHAEAGTVFAAVAFGMSGQLLGRGDRHSHYSSNGSVTFSLGSLAAS